MLKTVLETPQQNGFAERMKQTLIERAKSMRLHAGLPKMFWEDSVTTTTYLINRGPSVPLGFRIPEEEWQRKEVSLTHLREFGCDSYVKLKDVARDKLDAKSMKCTFIGYGSYEMGYRFWDSKDHKPRWSSDTSEGSENSGRFEDSGRSDEEDSEDKASSNEGGFETPHSYLEALSSKESVQWKKTINEEMVSLEKNQTWVKDEQDDRKKYKARLVVKGFQQKQGVYYNKIFSQVVKMTTIRLVLSIVASEDLHLEKLDVKTAFLHGDLYEDIYMTQPEGFQSAGKEENLMCKLKKRYKRCAMDHCCYLKNVGLSSIILQLYVDDMLVEGSDMAENKKLKRQLSQEFEMKDLGFAKQILGMSIIRDKTCQPSGDHFKLSKKQAPKTETSRRRMAKVPYASVVGIVMYAMVYTRPDITHAVGVVSEFMSNPGMEHWEAVKWLLRYLERFSDSDYGGCLDSGKSTTGYVFIVGGTTVSWMSRNQKCVAMSTHKAEYMAIVEAGKELIRYHYIQELVSEGTLSLKKILGAKNPANMLTKVVTTKKLKLCATSTGL
ncbi:retrovirus-related pol polyprotein from transposon TNT 1-94 [Tanacetum coccineum]